MTFHADGGTGRLVFSRAEHRRGSFVCRVEVTSENGDVRAVDLDMIDAYSSDMALFFKAAPDAVSAGRTLTTRSEFAELHLAVRPGEPPIIDVSIWWSDLGDDAAVTLRVRAEELRRACEQMTRFLGSPESS